MPSLSLLTKPDIMKNSGTLKEVEKALSHDE
jgi:hypothetical protein